MARLPVPPFDLYANLATGLKGWRLRRGLSLKAVADVLGYEISVIQAWESGTRFPNRDNLPLVVGFTGLEPCHLFCEYAGHCIPGRCVFLTQPA